MMPNKLLATCVPLIVTPILPTARGVPPRLVLGGPDLGVAEELLQCVPDTGVLLYRVCSRLGRRQGANDVAISQLRTKCQNKPSALKVTHFG